MAVTTPTPSVPAAAEAAGARGEPEVRELMTPREGFVTVSPDTSLREVAERLDARHVGGAPVMAGSTLLGVVSASGLMAFAAATPGAPAERTDQAEWRQWGPAAEWEVGSEAPDAFFLAMWMDAGEDVAGRSVGAGGPEWNVLDEHTAEEVMSRRVVTISPDAPLRDAAEKMRRAEIHRLLVTRRGRLVGVITSTDVLRAVADGRLVPAKLR